MKLTYSEIVPYEYSISHIAHKHAMHNGVQSVVDEALSQSLRHFEIRIITVSSPWGLIYSTELTPIDKDAIMYT
jgi:hypothetical protein